MRPEAFSVNEVDVIIADDEDICRAAGASALKRFGFLPARVHEVETGADAYNSVMDLQHGARQVQFGGQERCLPLIVFLDVKMSGPDGLGSAQRICGLFSQRLLRDPFLVCVSDRWMQDADQRLFHFALPKTFAASKIRYCFELCQQWWMQGGGEPGRVPLNINPLVHEIPEASQPMLPSQPQVMHTTSEVMHTPSQQPETPSSLPGRGAGNSIESLDNLAPPRPPFEDVEMICLVGRGSFGRVYRARWDISTVALKVVEQFDQAAQPSLMAFEGKLSSSLAHPNLVQTFKYSTRDVVVRGENAEDKATALRGFELWIVQEWCGLGSLRQKIASNEIVQQGGYGEVVEVCAEICSAARYLHIRGIIHGDLTAANVLLVERRCPKGYICKVSDFGLARVLDSGASGINTVTMGTVTYMPPELFQLEGSALTKKVDVYAFGVILWQLCTSSTPFEGLQPTQVVVMVAQGATLEMPHDVPPGLVRLFDFCVTRQPSDRPSFERIVQALLEMANLE